MDKEARYRLIAKRCVERVVERNMLYEHPQPLKLMTEQDYMSMLRVKLLKVQQGVDEKKRCNDLEDLIAYAVVLLDRWESRAKEEGEDET